VLSMSRTPVDRPTSRRRRDLEALAAISVALTVGCAATATVAVAFNSEFAKSYRLSATSDDAAPPTRS
jgi:hypothetical protein